MKRYVTSSNDAIMCMANLVPKRTGLSVDIWSEHRGCLRNVQHDTLRIKIDKHGQFSMSVTIEANPKILVQSKNISKSDMKKCQEAIDYIGRNHDLFLRHYNDVSDEFDDNDLFEALRERGEFK